MVTPGTVRQGVVLDPYLSLHTCETYGRAWLPIYPLLSLHERFRLKRCALRVLPAGCFCDGALKGYDDPDTRALCLSEALCLELCAGLPDCVSVDMHTQVNRCFLNEGDVCPAPCNPLQVSARAEVSL